MVNIIDGYSFDHDGTQYTLYKSGSRNKIDPKTRKPTGDILEYTDTIGYYSSITAMLQTVLKLATHDACSNAEVTQIGDYISFMGEICEKIRVSLETTSF